MGVERVGCDVVVVGASPAGLRAAWAAARGGARVVLLEARGVIGVPEAFARVVFEFLWPAGVRVPAGVVRRRLEGVRVESPSGFGVDVRASAWVLERTRFDRALALEAEAAGAEVRTGVVGLRARADRSLCASGLEVRGRVVVFADGARSLARGFLRPLERPGDVVWGAALEVEAPVGEGARRVRLGLGSHAPGGRSQLTPVGGGLWAHWTFYRGARSEAEARARAALVRDAEVVGLPVEAVAGARFLGVGLDPVRALPGRLVGDGVMVVGGAAGQGGVEGGLEAGAWAGAVAAEAVAAGCVDAAALASYEVGWKRARLGAYRGAAWAFGRLEALSDRGLDALLAPWDGWEVPVRDVVGLVHARRGRRVGAGLRLLVQNPVGAVGLARAAAGVGGAAAGVVRRGGRRTGA